MTEEERRRLIQSGIDPHYVEFLARHQARTRGEVMPQDAPSDYYAPPLTKYADIKDPRDQRRGLMKPLGSFVDALVRGPRVAQLEADKRALRDKRQEYAEQQPVLHAQMEGLITEHKLEGLKQAALRDDAAGEKARTLLKQYAQALDSRSAPSIPSWEGVANPTTADGRPAVPARRTGDGRQEPSMLPVTGQPDRSAHEQRLTLARKIMYGEDGDPSMFNLVASGRTEDDVLAAASQRVDKQLLTNARELKALDVTFSDDALGEATVDPVDKNFSPPYLRKKSDEQLRQDRIRATELIKKREDLLTIKTDLGGSTVANPAIVQ